MRDCKKCKHLVMFDYKNRSYSCESRECEFEPEEQEPKPMVEIDLYSVIKQKYIEREVLDKILKEIADLKAKDVMKELNRERTTAFEWTKHDIYRIVEKAKAEEGEE